MSRVDKTVLPFHVAITWSTFLGLSTFESGNSPSLCMHGTMSLGRCPR